jgi:hypothetical protein
VAHTLIPAADLPLLGQETVTKMCALAVIADKAVASKQIAMCFSLICVEIVFDCVCSVSQASFMASLVGRAPLGACSVTIVKEKNFSSFSSS